MQITHDLKPIYNKNSKILLLGTLPSPKSREIGFYYSHPQNRMWKILSQLLNQPLPQTKEEKTLLLLENKIAMWDVLSSCEINGADDNSIKNPIPNDLSLIYSNANIKATFTTGSKATSLYKKFNTSESILLPSTSPANCRFYTYEKLVESYKVILEYIK